MSVQLSPDASVQFPFLVSPAASSSVDFPHAGLRYVFVQVLQALDVAISAEQDLELAMDERGRGLFDPALQIWLKAAEDSWQDVKNLLVDLNDICLAMPTTCSLRKMARCLDQIIGCEDPVQVQKDFQFAELLTYSASVIPIKTAIGRDAAMILREAMARLERLASLPNHHLDALGFDPSSRPTPGLEAYWA